MHASERPQMLREGEGPAGPQQGRGDGTRVFWVARCTGVFCHVILPGDPVA